MAALALTRGSSCFQGVSSGRCSGGQLPASASAEMQAPGWHLAAEAGGGKDSAGLDPNKLTDHKAQSGDHREMDFQQTRTASAGGVLHVRHARPVQEPPPNAAHPTSIQRLRAAWGYPSRLPKAQF